MEPKKILAASLLALGCIATSGVARAEAGAFRRALYHPQTRPVNVPEEYVLTHSGFFHPSCVITVDDDEVIGDDAIVRGSDGKEHLKVEPCAYPRFDRKGVLVDKTEAPKKHAHDTYDGWINWFEHDGDYDANGKLSHQWVVPLAPMKFVQQDVAFFNDLESDFGGGDIIQPVLDFGEIGTATWIIESEHCCVNNNDMQSNPVVVQPGDVIRGDVSGTGCDGSSCQSWTITTTDVTTGKSTVLNTTSGAQNVANPGVLETYDVTSCDMLPANGEITFEDVSDNPLDYQYYDYDSGGTQLPGNFPTNCGYDGQHNGSSYTLFFGPNPTPENPNTPTTSAASSSSAATSGSGGAGVSSTAATDVASSTIAVSVTSAATGAGGATTVASTGAFGDLGGQAPQNGDGFGDDKGVTGGCGCSTAPSDRALGTAAACLLSLLFIARSRRRVA